MGSNSFSSFIPVTLCTLPILQWLLLSLNNLTIDTSTPEANIFSCLANLRNLSMLNLAGNPLNTALPASLGNLSTSLQYIDFRRCNFKGDIPKEIGNLSSLISLQLGFNQLSGSLPTTLGRVRNLQGMYLSDNKLVSYIPDELCQLYNLADMEMPHNLFSGSIPSCLGDLATSLNLMSNLLTSTVSSFLWQLKYILDLDLSSNSLVGSLSEDIGNLKVVAHIDLSNNHFSGSIPSSIGGLQDLFSLSLANNNLEGHSPSSFGNSLSLELLDLSNNSLSGVIPKSLEALSYLQYLNFSFNKLLGEIPTGGYFKNFSSESFVSNGALCGATRLLVPTCKTKAASRYFVKYITIGSLSAILLVVLVSMILCRKRIVEAATDQTTLSPQKLLWRKVSRLELLSATNGFSECNLLGTGAFGSVYKGTMSDGIDVAIKVFNLEVEGVSKSSDNECEMLSNIRYINLLKIITCCSQTDFKAVVGYNDRCCIGIGIPSSPIIHCDLKPSNILIDDDMVAHIADFGIAKLLGGGNSTTHTITLATIGYMAPGGYTVACLFIKLRDKRNSFEKRGCVYSFGIVLMETFTKRKPTDEMFGREVSMKQWVADSLFPGGMVEVVDANLFGTEEDDDFASKECLSSLMRLALVCCAESPEKRISMQDALAMLNKIKTKFLKNAAGGAV
ncbi:putative protein kinase RLK-Pelle-LRR-XII-1 family [Rosa chinensis]|uniref:Protein kinase domain-containing protein n=1 Tax=Rosa chinensis TaxID=74649 RepID=A0A2P6Q628_ROSCH|nr:putative protein kinase RLK-Pelle-LRR-XII-1 family [Rosa chinensis]